MTWDGPRQRRLAKALLGAFNRRELARLLDAFSIKIDHVSSANDNDEDAFDKVVDYFVKRYRADELLEGAIAERPKNADLLAVRAPAGQDTQPLLGYECGRDDQNRAVRAAVGKLHTTPHRPLVLVVHGHRDQCPEQYVDYLAVARLPRLLNLDAGRSSKHLHVLPWNTYPTAEEFVAELDQKMADKHATAGRDAYAPRAEVAEWVFDSHPLYAVLTFVGQGRADDLTRFGWFLDYWAAWPDAAGKRRVVVCACVESGPAAAKGGFAGLLADPKRITPPPGIVFAVLPELADVAQGDVRPWVAAQTIGRRCAGTASSDERVALAFEDRDPLPIKLLAPRLRAIMADCC